MLVFGLGTLPAVFTLSSVSAALVPLRARRWSGVFVFAVGGLLILRGSAALGIVPHTMLW